MSDDEPEGVFSATGSPEDPEFVEETLPEESPTEVTVLDEPERQSVREVLMQRMGVDIGVFAQKQTWQAFAISLILFGVIAYSALSIFGMTSQMYGVSDDVRPVPDFEIETLNRTAYEMNSTNETGWFKLSDHRGEVVVLDFMAVDCGSCHYVQEHIEEEQATWENLQGPYPIIVVSIGSWYNIEDLDKLNGTFGSGGRQMEWIVGSGTSESVILNETTGERGDIVEQYSAQLIPLAVVIDHEGYMVAKENTGTPLDRWKAFDGAILKANQGETEDIRLGLAKVDRSSLGLFLLGLLLGVLVYFSPCAFPVLPSYIGYYISLGLREEELRESGKLQGSMPNHLTVGLLASAGMLTFFLFIGVFVYGLSAVFDISGWLTRFALFIAFVLFGLGAFMLMGGTSHLLGWVQKLVDRFSTTEMDSVFTPRRNMYLWGIGYAAASIDCTAAAVLPFVAYLVVVGSGAIITGLGGIMLSVLLLMTGVTIIVGMGSKALEDKLRRATGMIKLLGAWMMMFAGIGLTLYLTQSELIVALL